MDNKPCRVEIKSNKFLQNNLHCLKFDNKFIKQLKRKGIHIELIDRLFCCQKETIHQHILFMKVLMTEEVHKDLGEKKSQKIDINM